MSPRGARLFGIVFAALFAGAVWFQVAKGRVAAEAKAADEKQDAELLAVRQENRALQESIRVARAEAARSAVKAEPEGYVQDPALPVTFSLESPPMSLVDRAARTKALLELIKSGLLGELTYAAPSAYKISTKVAKLSEVLGLTPEETDTLQKAAGAVGDTLLRSAQVTPGDNEVSIEMKDSAAARTELAKMRETFKQVLGEDGHAVYDALGFKVALENSLSNLGLVPFTMMVAKTMDPNTGSASYTYLRKGTAAVIQANAAGAARGAAVAAVTDAEAEKLTAARLAAQAKADEARLKAGRPETPIKVATREALGSALGPLETFLPPGF